MDPLVLVTILALLMATMMMLIAWRTVRDERRRSAARMAALAEEIPVDGRSRSAVSDAGRREEPVRASVTRRSAPDDRRPPTADARRLPDPAAEAPIRPDAPPVQRPVPAPVLSGAGHALLAGVDADVEDSTAALFAIAERPSRGSWKLAIACLTLVALIGAATVFVLRDQDPARDETAAAEPAPSLELVSLRHTRQGATLTITGLVRNPMAGRAVQKLTAVAFVFDRAGAFLASGRAPLDFTTLGPGDESSFVITLDAPSGVSRYRVSFRTDGGSVMPHVDRREADAAGPGGGADTVRLKS